MSPVSSVRPSELPASDREAWADFCAATPLFRSPLLGPDFAEAVARRRDDAHVAVFRRNGRTVGFLPHHRRPSGLARPIGAPFCDYHALVTEPGLRLDGAQALAGAGLSTFRFSNLIDPYRCFDAARQTPQEGFVMKLGPMGAGAYLDGLREPNPKRAKNWRRLENKLEREVGEITLRAPDHSPQAFAALMQWKREQLVRGGLHDIFRPDWTLGLMQDLFEQRQGPFQGLMLTLRAGGRLVAGHFGVRLGNHFHSWISSVDPDLAATGAGNTLLLRVIEAMPQLDLNAFDMGSGHAHYKEPFCTGRIPVASGVAVARGAAHGMAHSVDQALALAAERSEAVARLLRRLDHIAAIELSVGGRLLGVAQAFAGQARRAKSLDRAPEKAPERALLDT
ncbi:MAG TPA: GNAT family N-acetyltransferase [Caulobacteraceae bacterium]|nr:GNAT family N-acetyltransferase [Caulobacteraceae bacterium]